MMQFRNLSFTIVVPILAGFWGIFCVCASCPAGEAKAIQQAQQLSLPAAPSVIDVSRDGATAAVGAGAKLIVLDLTSGKLRREWELDGKVIDVALPQTGDLVAVTLGSDVVDVYNVATGKRVQLHRKDAAAFLQSDGQRQIALYPDATKLISVGGRRRLYLSDMKTGLWDHIIYHKYSRIPTPIISPDGTHVALIGRPDANEISGHISMFKVRRGLQPLWTKWHEGRASLTHASFSTDSTQFAACGSGDGVRVWDVASGKRTAHHQIDSETPLLGVSFVAETDQLLTASSIGLTLLDSQSGKVLESSQVSKEMPLRGFASSSDGTTVVTYSNQPSISVWSLKTQRTPK